MSTAARLLDRGEQAAALVLYAFLVQRIWPHDLSAASLAPALLLLSEGVIILFLLIRRPATDISLRPQDWAAAIAGTVAPLLVVKTAEPSNLAIGAFFLLFGMFTQISAKFSLRRSFGLVAANRGVKTGGAYRYVRHPMYLGYMISHVGFLLMSPTFWNFAVYAVGWSCLVLRVGFEERLLSGDADYRAFKEKVRYRLLPGVY
jgi:protein-S-isoprenylcysteine O-methyltransferase Ste14